MAPSRYKCVLVDDDDEIGGIAGGVSYVSELQQRRLQAQATSLAEKVPQIVSALNARCILLLECFRDHIDYQLQRWLGLLPSDNQKNSYPPTVSMEE